MIDLEKRQAELAYETSALAEARAEKQAGKEAAAAKSLAARERQLAREARRVVDANIAEARQTIRDVINDLKKAPSVEAAEAAREELNATAAETHARLPSAAPMDLNSLREAMQTRDGGGQFKDSYGPGASVVGKAPSRPAPRTPGPAKSGGASGTPAGAAVLGDGAGEEMPLVLQNKANTVDVRGMRAKDALDKVEAQLDKAVLQSSEAVFVVHGHGTGALRKAVRQYLAVSPYVNRFRAGERQEGGDGVSVAYVRA